MGIFRQFPYSNFHEFNLDWLLGVVKALIEDLEVFDKDYEEFKEYVYEYLKNLDVEEYVREYIDELWESGALGDIIMEAIDDLRIRVQILEDENKKGSIANYYYSYMKVGNETDAPCSVIYNPVRSGVTFFTPSDAQGNVKCGDLKSDLITKENEITISGITHINDATFCNINNEILVADYIAGTPKIIKLQPASLQPIGAVDLTGFEGSAVSCVACDNITNQIYIAGEDANNRNIVHFAELDKDYTIIKQFYLDLSLIANFAEYPWSYFQGSDVVNGEFTIIKTMRNNTPRQNGFILTSIDFVNEKISSTKQVLAGDEAESLMFYNNSVYVYGYTNPSYTNVYSTVIELSLSPIANMTRVIIVDETKDLNGDGTATNPYNNLTSAFYDYMYCSANTSIITLNSDISKEVVLPQNFISDKSLRITANNKTIDIANNLFFNRSYINFQGITFTSTHSANWCFQSGCFVTFYDCKFRKTIAGAMLLRFFTSQVFINNGSAELTVDDAVGIIQLRYESLMMCEWSSITTSVNTNALVNTLGGCIINTRNITALTTPFPQTSNSVLLGKNA